MTETESFNRNVIFYQELGSTTAEPEQSEPPRDAEAAIARIARLAYIGDADDADADGLRHAPNIAFDTVGRVVCPPV